MPEEFPDIEASIPTQVQLWNICNKTGKSPIIEVKLKIKLKINIYFKSLYSIVYRYYVNNRKIFYFSVLEYIEQSKIYRDNISLSRQLMVDLQTNDPRELSSSKYY